MGKQVKKRKKKKSGGKKSVANPPKTPLSPVIKQETVGEEIAGGEFDDQDARIFNILGVENEEDAEVNYDNLNTFSEHLEKEMTLPVLVTGIEDMGCFGWEEYYTFGPGSKAEYDKLRKTRPSFRDQYELLSLEDDVDEEGLHGNARRISDGKEWILPLADLEAVDKNSRNAKLLKDYVDWYVNYR